MKLKSAVGVLDAMAEKVAKEQPHAKALKGAIHSRRFTRKKADSTTPQTLNAAEARARLLAFAILRTGQNHFPHGILGKSESHHPLMYALPLECEKLPAVMGHRFFNDKGGASARVLLNEQSKMPREAPAAVAAAALHRPGQKGKGRPLGNLAFSTSMCVYIYWGGFLKCGSFLYKINIPSMRPISP